MDDLINGTLELRYSLVAASIPGLENLHEMSQFVFMFVDDPVITPFDRTITYQPRSSMTISITVSVYLYVHTHINSLWYKLSICSSTVHI